MNYKRIIFFLPALLLFCGCGIYTNYQRSETLTVDSLTVMCRDACRILPL